jgi:hypothetical protein
VKYPIVLVGKSYWSGLIDWMQDTLCTNGNISQEDFDLFRVVDTAEEAVSKIKDYQNLNPSTEVNF